MCIVTHYVARPLLSIGIGLQVCRILRAGLSKNVPVGKAGANPSGESHEFLDMLQD